MSERDFDSIMKEFEHMKKNNLHGIQKPKELQEQEEEHSKFKNFKLPLIGKKSAPKRLEITRT